MGHLSNPIKLNKTGELNSINVCKFPLMIEPSQVQNIRI